MISLPLPPETENLIARLSDEEKKALSTMIWAFVNRPKRSMSQVMDDMANYAKAKGLDLDKIDDLLKQD
jgi:hypothetical protein